MIASFIERLLCAAAIHAWHMTCVAARARGEFEGGLRVAEPANQALAHRERVICAAGLWCLVNRFEDACPLIDALNEETP